MKYKVSIIIPTYNRSQFIIKTLISFINQTYDKELFEIIICNNNSTDNTNEIIHKFKEDHSEYKIICLIEKKQGVHYARNLAAKYASGDILYFTDDDMIASEKLIENIAKPFEDNTVGIVTGKVLPVWEKRPPKWVEKYMNNWLLSLNDLGNIDFKSENDIVFSCHEAIRKEAFWKSGGFHPENTAGEWVGDGETGMNNDIKKLGYQFFYKADSVIGHIIPPCRTNQAYLNKRLHNQGNCDSYTEYKSEPINSLKDIKKRKKKYARRALVQLVSFAGRYKLSYLRFVLGYLHYYIARIKYDYRLLNDREFRKLVDKENWISEE